MKHQSIQIDNMPTAPIQQIATQQNQQSSILHNYFISIRNVIEQKLNENRNLFHSYDKNKIDLKIKLIITKTNTQITDLNSSSIKEIKLLNSNIYPKYFDNKIIKLISEIKDYPPFPDEIKENILSITLPITIFFIYAQ
ncbi:MAG: hypothetical protein HQK49_05020 [Oligoflexia bacterium]|nr:hypothetical protein [Oligoflexia bacterium]